MVDKMSSLAASPWIAVVAVRAWLEQHLRLIASALILLLALTLLRNGIAGFV